MLRYVRVETRLIDLTPSRCAGQSSLRIASLKAAIRPLTDGSPLKVPTELLCRNGAVAQMLTSEAVR